MRVRVRLRCPSIRPRPLQDLEVASTRRTCACLLVPRAAIRPRPLQNLEMATARCSGARAAKAAAKAAEVAGASKDAAAEIDGERGLGLWY